MTNEEYLAAKDNVINALDKAIQNGDWEASLFFQNIGKRLRELKEIVMNELEEEEKQQQTDIIPLIDLKPGFIKVYISLYQADGDNLDRWLHTIKMLGEYNISRPIYGKEEHITALIRSKTDAKREAYVIACVPTACMVEAIPGQPFEDRFGHPLLSLKERSIKLENIIEFVHMDHRYRVHEGRLILRA